MNHIIIALILLLIFGCQDSKPQTLSNYGPSEIKTLESVAVPGIGTVAVIDYKNKKYILSNHVGIIEVKE